MRKDKETAFELRRSGQSYREIRQQLGVPLSTLAEWFAGEEWSRIIGKNLSARRTLESRIHLIELNRIRGLRLAKLYEKARSDARKEFGILREEPLFVAGLVAYWGEGDKVSKSNIRLSNTDPGMVLLFKRFLTYTCNASEEKITCWLLLYPDLDDSTCKDYWSGKIHLPLSNFRKSMYVAGRHKTKRLSYGVCNLNISSRYLKEKMLLWLRLMSEEYSDAGMVQW